MSVPLCCLLLLLLLVLVVLLLVVLSSVLPTGATAVTAAPASGAGASAGTP